MSKRIPSILIGEDARGAALNETLGLPDILDFSVENGRWKNNEFLAKQIKDYLSDLRDTQYMLLSSAYRKMNLVYHNNFEPYIRRICSDDYWA